MNAACTELYQSRPALRLAVSPLAIYGSNFSLTLRFKGRGRFGGN